jgi:hypothetical protein
MLRHNLASLDHLIGEAFLLHVLIPSPTSTIFLCVFAALRDFFESVQFNYLVRFQDHGSQ